MNAFSLWSSQVIAAMKHGLGLGPQVDLLLNEKYYRLKKYYSGEVLDFGAGSCFYTAFLKSKNLQVTPLDRHNQSKQDSIQAIEYDGKHIPFAENAFSTTCCFFVLHHIDQPSNIFQELIRVTADYLIIGEDVVDKFTDNVFASLHGSHSRWTFETHSFRSTESWNHLFQSHSLQTVETIEIPRWRIPYYPVKRVIFVLKRHD